MAHSLGDIPEDKLVRRAQAGDEDLFTDLFNSYAPMLGRYLAGLVTNLEDRDELVVETFLRAWHSLPYLQSVVSFKSWLYRIATNAAMDHLRTEKIHKQTSFEVIGDVENSIRFETIVEKKELMKLALQKVPPKYRACLLLHVEGKLSEQEIAEAVGISPRSVKAYISYGREHLRAAYYRIERESTT